jgi:hypothetical protein
MESFDNQSPEIFYKKLYEEVWENFNDKNFSQYYDQSVKAYSEDLILNYAKLLEHLHHCKKIYAYVKANYHKITAITPNRFKVWMTQVAYDLDRRPILQLETIVTYEVIRGKIQRLWFMWDSPVNEIVEV